MTWIRISLVCLPLMGKFTNYGCLKMKLLSFYVPLVPIYILVICILRNIGNHFIYNICKKVHGLDNHQ